MSVVRFQSRPTGMFFLETVLINNFNIFLHLFRNNDSRSSGFSCTHVHVYSRCMEEYSSFMQKLFVPGEEDYDVCYTTG